MPIFKPFRGVRPHSDYIDCFPTPSIDSLSEEELSKKVQDEHSYIRMVKPFVLSKSKDLERNLRKIRANFDELLEGNKLIQDGSCYYLYEQIMADKTIFRGLLGLTSVQDFLDGKIKKHEATIPDRKEKLAQYLDKVAVQAEPVLLTYGSNPKIELLMNHEEKNIPIINYLAGNGTRHKIWKIDNRLKMQQYKEAFEKVEAFYIADGHHRMGSAALNATFNREKNKKQSGSENYNYVYSFLVSKDSIKIHDYNRLLKDLNGLSEEQFLKELEKYFLIHEKGETPYFPSQKFHISMYLGGKFYSLHVKHDLRKLEDSGNDLDHLLLEKYIFDNVLGLGREADTDKIAYVKGTSGIDGILELKKRVDSQEYQAAFGIYPINFNDLLKVSDLNIKMPPKCTFIEPKLMTALVMYDMK